MNYDIVPMRKIKTDGTVSPNDFTVQVKMNNGDVHTNITMDEAFDHIGIEIREMMEKLYGDNTPVANGDEYRSDGNIIDFPSIKEIR